MTITPAQSIANRKTIYAFWLGAFNLPSAAAGLTAQALGESSYDPAAIGDHGTAYSLQQWHGVRAAAIEAGCGIDVTKLPPLADALKAALWELRNPEKGALAHILSAKTAYDAGYAACRYWERPAATADYAKRGNLAEEIAVYFSKNPVA